MKILYGIILSAILFSSITVSNADAFVYRPIQAPLTVERVHVVIDDSIKQIPKESIKIHKVSSDTANERYQVFGIGKMISGMDDYIIVTTNSQRDKVYLKVPVTTIINKVFVVSSDVIETRYHWDHRERVPYVDGHPARVPMTSGTQTNFSYDTNMFFTDHILSKVINIRSYWYR